MLSLTLCNTSTKSPASFQQPVKGGGVRGQSHDGQSYDIMAVGAAECLPWPGEDKMPLFPTDLM